MSVHYKDLVFNLLQKRLYPVLEDYVILDIYYKIIDPTFTESEIKTYDAYVSDPRVTYENENEPFKLVFLSGEGRTFFVHKTNRIDPSLYKTECLRIKLPRNFVNQRFKLYCQSFEEEINTFLAYLNTDIPKIRDFLDITFIESTRFLPQHIQMWVHKYKVCSIPPAQSIHLDDPKWRLFNNYLSIGMSKDGLISTGHPTLYYSTIWKTFIPLAYNPLENPVIV